MAGVKMEEYKQIHQCFSNKNHIFSVDLVRIASFTQATSSQFHTSPALFIEKHTPENRRPKTRVGRRAEHASDPL